MNSSIDCGSIVIESVHDAIEIMRQFDARFDNDDKRSIQYVKRRAEASEQLDSWENNLGKIFSDEQAEVTRYKFPFGIWFRGQNEISNDWKLLPNVFRDYTASNDGVKRYDEGSMFMHFKARLPQYQNDHHSTFDWLTLMQHYELPTRLLDWTESIITALYFAVNEYKTKSENFDETDGVIYALNAGSMNDCTRLNHKSRSNLICFDDSSDVIIRSELSKSRSIQDLNRHLQKTGNYDHVIKALLSNSGEKSIKPQEPLELLKLDNEMVKRIAYPIAVFPNRINGRMLSQSSVFTLFGGKNEHDQASIKDIGAPASIEDVQNEARKHPEYKKDFLMKFIVSGKRRIRRELGKIGINEPSIYPEVEYQSEFIKRQWRFLKV